MSAMNSRPDSRPTTLSPHAATYDGVPVLITHREHIPGGVMVVVTRDREYTGTWPWTVTSWMSAETAVVYTGEVRKLDPVIEDTRRRWAESDRIMYGRS